MPLDAELLSEAIDRRREKRLPNCPRNAAPRHQQSHINFFIVLDLTDKSDGLAALPACVHIRTLPGPAGDPRPRTLIMLRVQGNKRDPSSL